MSLLIKIIALVLSIALIIGPFILIHVRNIFREQKNYERGLKFVTLLIHLPPPSDDIEVGGRDNRDVNDETISKAQIIYDIISSTWQKGIKHKFYGQRHFSFEVVGSQGFVYLYAAVPISLLEIVKQAIISAYPTARLEETSENNIFNQVGKLNGTLGGEFVLKESYAYPIATYQDLKRDTMQATLSSLYNLGKEDGVALQILMRPTDSKWRKVATGYSTSKRKGESSKKGFELIFWWAKSLFVGLVKPPEPSKEKESSRKELSNMELSTLDAIDDKTRHAAFEVVIRVVVSSNVSQRSQSILSQIIASFALFDQPGKNGFKYVPAKDLDKLILSYVLRFFPQHNNKTILNSVELATIFHFPDQNNIPTTQLNKQASKQVDGPRNIPEGGQLLGFNVFRGVKKPIRLGVEDRRRHLYAVGQTGTGKSQFMENLALQDMLNGNGFAFIDPHGDVVENLLAMIPKERTEDLIYFAPGDMDYPMGLNLFEYDSPKQKDFLIQEALNMLYKLYDPNHTGIMGPRYESLFRNAALTVMADPAGGTFVDIPKLFRDPKFVEQKLQYVTDQNVIDFWKKEMPQSQRSNDFGEVVSWFSSKFGAFLSNDMMRNIIGQNKSAFDLRDVMDNNKILLVNLSKGATGELNSKLLGMIFVMKAQAAAMSRVDIPEEERKDFSLYIDEFQNFTTDTIATIMSEARKFHLNLIVANQFTTQLSQEIRDAVFGNMGTIVSFRIGQNDLDGIGKYFQPIFDGDDLLRLPNFNTIVRTLVGGVPTQPFSMNTLPQLGTPNRKLAEALKQLSAAKYGRPKAVVEKEIFERMQIKEDPKPTVNVASPNSAGGLAPGQGAGQPSVFDNPKMSAQAPLPSANASFIDSWLAKKAPQASSLASVPQQQPASQPPTNSQPVINNNVANPPIINNPNPISPQPTIQTPSAASAPIIQTHSSGPLQSINQPNANNPAQSAGIGLQDPAILADGRIRQAAPAPQPTQGFYNNNLGDGKTVEYANQQAKQGSNISSDELERAEVDKIAGELKTQLVSQQVKEEPEPKNGDINDGDTIFIDREGNLVSKLEKDKD